MTTPTPQAMPELPEVVAFLQGEGPLDGVWYGEKHPTERGNFWWRKYLRAAIQQAAVAVPDYEMLMNPRRWTREMSAAWHGAIPDVQKAFEALRAVAPEVNRDQVHSDSGGALPDDYFEQIVDAMRKESLEHWDYRTERGHHAALARVALMTIDRLNLVRGGSSGVTQPLTDERIEAAAKVLAQCMDYPWSHMPEKGRGTMRNNVKLIIEAARDITSAPPTDAEAMTMILAHAIPGRPDAPTSQINPGSAPREDGHG